MKVRALMARSAKPETVDLTVNEHEGSVLGLIARMQPVTRYRLYKAFGESPTTSYNKSKGSLYPLIGRMIQRGFVKSEVGKTKRGSEVLSLTPPGYQALVEWVTTTGPEHSFTHDPLLLRLQALADLKPKDRLRWIAEAKAALLKTKEELKSYREAVTGPYADIVHGTAVAMIEAKLEWLDRLLIQIVQESEARASARGR